MEIPLFDLKELRRQFFVIACINFGLVCIATLLPSILNLTIYYKFVKGLWLTLCMAIIFVVSFLLSRKWKIHLANILQISNSEEQIEKYQVFYKNRLWWNLFSVMLTCLLVLLTNGRYMYYLLLAQFFLYLLSYPRKSLIALELKNPDIVFT